MRVFRRAQCPELTDELGVWRAQGRLRFVGVAGTSQGTRWTDGTGGCGCGYLPAWLPGIPAVYA